MNASGRLNTCKSRGNRVFGLLTTGARVSNAYATCLIQRDSPEKFGLIPHVLRDRMIFKLKIYRYKMGMRDISLLVR